MPLDKKSEGVKRRETEEASKKKKEFIITCYKKGRSKKDLIFRLLIEN